MKSGNLGPVIGATGKSVRRRCVGHQRGLLLAGSAFAAGLLIPAQANAACSVNTGNPDKITCSGSSSGISHTSTNNGGITVTLDGTADVTPNGLDLSAGGPTGSGTRYIDLTMENGATIHGSGQQLHVTTTTADSKRITGTWSLDGSVESTGGNAIVFDLARGTGGGGRIDLGIGGNGSVSAGGDAITITGQDTANTNATITNDGTIEAGGTAVSLSSGGQAQFEVTNNNTIGTSASRIGDVGISITGDDAEADGKVTNSSGASLYTAGNAVDMGLGGNAEVANSGTIGSGQVAIKLEAGGFANVDNTDGGAITAVTDAVHVAATGDVTINNGDPTDANSTGSITSMTGTGIHGESTGTGSVAVTNTGGSTIDAAQYGIQAVGQDGNVTVGNFGAIGRQADAVGADGIAASSTGGDIIASNGIDDTGAVETGATIHARGDGIHARSTAGGDVTALNAGAIVAEGTGIFARSQNGNGDAVVVNLGTVRGGAGVYARASANSGAGTGDLHIYNGRESETLDPANAHGNVNALIDARDGNAVTAVIMGGRGNLTVANWGRYDFFGTTSEKGGIVAEGGSAIDLTNYGEDRTIFDNYGTVMGPGTEASPVIRLRTDAGDTTGQGAMVNNHSGGVMSGANVPSDWSEATGAGIDPTDPTTWSPLAAASGDTLVTATGGPAQVNNAGFMIGRVDLQTEGSAVALVPPDFWTANNVINNNGVWVTTGDNHIDGGSSDEIYNGVFGSQGVIQTAVDGMSDETTRFLGLDSFHNGDGTGIVSMMDGGAGDRTSVSGDFVGDTFATSYLSVDAELAGPGSVSDVLAVGGNVSGQTSISVNDTSTDPGAYNGQGIAVVQRGGAEGGLDDFALSSASDHYDARFGGVLGKGAFLCYLGADTSGSSAGCTGGYCVALYSTPDDGLRQLSVAGTGAVTAWYDTALVWKDRQAQLRGGHDATRGSGASGAWIKVLGTRTNRDATQNTTLHGRDFAFDLAYQQDTYGLLGGFDSGPHALGAMDGTFDIGVVGGYVDSTLRFDSDASSFHYRGGTVGLTGTYRNGGFFLDGLAKVDLLTLDMNSAAFGHASGSVDATTWGFMGNGGYRYDLSSTVYVEPMVTFAATRSNIGKIDTGGGATASFGDARSLRAAAGARIGTSLSDWQAHDVQGALTARVWNEFDGTSAATIGNSGPDATVTDDFSGTFGEISGGIDVVSKGTGWGGFVNGGVRFNSQFTSASVRTGVNFTW